MSEYEDDPPAEGKLCRCCLCPVVPGEGWKNPGCPCPCHRQEQTAAQIARQLILAVTPQGTTAYQVMQLSTKIVSIVDNIIRTAHAQGRREGQEEERLRLGLPAQRKPQDA